MYDLPSEDPEEPGLPDEFHWLQPELLRLTFRPPNIGDDKVFVGSDLNLYYDPHHLQWYKRPDWFAVLGVSRLYDNQDLRLSYVIWQEGVNPFVVVELLSPGTEAEDLGNTLRAADRPPTKWQVYEHILRVPYYFTFSRYTDEFRAYGLMAGRYQPLTSDPQGFWLPEAELGLGIWTGTFEGIERRWLRWYDHNRQWILTPTERQQQRAETEKQRAETERQRADQAELALAQLQKRLKQAGIDVAQFKEDGEDIT